MPAPRKPAPLEGAGAPTNRGPASSAPTFRDLTPDECREVLERHHVGRLAYTFHDRVNIEPLHYAYENGWLYGRTAPGSKLNTLAHHPWVAFEVDEIGGVFDWRSVVARGAFYRVEPEGTAAERVAWRRAVRLLDAIVPGTLAPNDPVAFRNVVFHIYVDEMTGRAASSRAARGRAD